MIFTAVGGDLVTFRRATVCFGVLYRWKRAFSVSNQRSYCSLSIEFLLFL